MSLINRMLADLERRGALSGSDAAAFALRPVPPGTRVAAAPTLALFAAVAVAAAWVWSAGPSPKRPAPHAPPQTVSAPGDLVLAGVAPGTGRTDEAPEPGLRLSAPPPVSEPRPPSGPKAAGMARPAQAVPAPASPSPAPSSSGSAPGAAASPRSAEPAAKPAPAPAAEAAIDKRMLQPTPRQRAEAEFGRAVNLMRQGRAGEAIESLQSALEMFPGHESARQVLAALLVENRRVADAEQALAEGVRLNPGNPRLALALARIQMDRGGWDAALETLRRAEAGGAGDADYQGFTGSVLQRLSRHQEAIPHYIAAVRLAPQSGLWYLGLGISLEAEGRAADARESFQRARATQSLNPELVAFVDQRLAQLAPRQGAAGREQ